MDKYQIHNNINNRFPLIEWKWGRPECIEAIHREGLEVPRKSACFFCPAAKKREVLELSVERPDLFARALAIERQAEGLGTVRGLGRNWSWDELVNGHPDQLKLLPEPSSISCACFDGDSDEVSS